MYAAWGYGQEEALFLLLFGRRSYLLHVTAGWGWGCWSRGASSGGSKRGRGHVVSKGMVELLDLGLEKRRIRRHSTGIGMMGAAFVRALTKGSRMGLCWGRQTDTGIREG